jgi:hypothetical protein
MFQVWMDGKLNFEIPVYFRMFPYLDFALVAESFLSTSFTFPSLISLLDI